MFAHDAGDATSDLSHWLGPLSPAFATMHEVAATGSSPAPSVRSHEEPVLGAPQAPDVSELRSLFHTLNNQLGVILTYAELVEAKSPDEGLKARAGQIVKGVIDALETSRKIRSTVVK